MSRTKPDAGLWYYHAPEGSRAGMPKVHYPPPSQIPGLNGVAIDPRQTEEEEKEKNSKYWFKETDTAYTKLAKMGGRKDLLVIPDSKPVNGQDGAPQQNTNTNNARNRYANTSNSRRCDWFYQLDNLAEDAARAANEPKEVHHFQVPDYMSHHERNPKPPNEYRSNAPFATYGKNVTDSIDGGDPTDKTRRIQEPLKQGCGRRLAKQKEMDRHVQHNYYPPEFDQEPQNDRTLRSAPNPAPRYEYSKAPQMEGSGDMTKLLSYGYQRDWVDEQNKWWNQNEKRATRFAEDNGMDPNLPPRTIMAGNPSNGPGVTGSEYSQQYAQYGQPQSRRLDAHVNAERMTYSRPPYGSD